MSWKTMKKSTEWKCVSRCARTMGGFKLIHLTSVRCVMSAKRTSLARHVKLYCAKRRQWSKKHAITAICFDTIDKRFVAPKWFFTMPGQQNKPTTTEATAPNCKKSEIVGRTWSARSCLFIGTSSAARQFSSLCGCLKNLLLTQNSHLLTQAATTYLSHISSLDVIMDTCNNEHCMSAPVVCPIVQLLLLAAVSSIATWRSAILYSCDRPNNDGIFSCHLFQFVDYGMWLLQLLITARDDCNLV